MANKKALEALTKAINKRYGAGTLLPASQAKSLVTSRIAIGIPGLDIGIGGGIPRGKIITVKGEYSTGKTGLCLKVVAQFQRHCRFCATPLCKIDVLTGEYTELNCDCGKNEPMRVVWMDAERSFDRDWAARWGIDIDNIHVIQCEYAEQAIDVADICIRSHECDLLVVDSVAALTPAVEVEQSSEKWQMGVAARLMNKAMRKWTSGMNSGGLLAETNCTILLINQIRMSLGGYHPATTSPGGKGMDFFQSVEIRLKRKEWVEDAATKRPISIHTEFVIKKNKTAPAMRTGAYTLYFVDDPKNGFKVGDTNYVEQIINMATYWGIIKKGGAWFTLPGHDKRIQGAKKTAELLAEDPDLLADIEKRVLEREHTWISSGESGDMKPVEDEEDEE